MIRNTLVSHAAGQPVPLGHGSGDPVSALGTFRIDYGQSLKDRIAALKWQQNTQTIIHRFDKLAANLADINPSILAPGFIELSGKGVIEVEWTLFRLGREMLLAEANETTAAENSEHPWIPAGIEHLLEYLKTYQASCENEYIVASGTTVLVEKLPRTPIYFFREYVHHLHLMGSKKKFKKTAVFLAIRPKK